MANQKKLQKSSAYAKYDIDGDGIVSDEEFFCDIERVQALADISNLFYISGAGIVGAYMGASAFMSKSK